MGCGGSAHAELRGEEATVVVTTSQAAAKTPSDQLDEDQQGNKLEVSSSHAPEVRECKEEEIGPKEATAENRKQQEELRQKEVEEEDELAAKDCTILQAVESGNVAAVRHFLRVKPDCVNTEDKKHGDPLLSLAATKGHLEVLQLLLAGGAALEAKSRDGLTALHLASGHGHGAVVEKLLTAGAAVDVLDSSGATELHKAAGQGHTDVLERLLAAGAKVDALDDKGNTALHGAAFEGKADVVEQLLAAGAAMDVPNTYGRRPYDVAKAWGRKKVMAVLDPVFVVFVALMSGRDCKCHLSEIRTVGYLRRKAERELGVTIKCLVGPDGQALNDSDTLWKAEIRPGATVTAVS